MAWKQVSSGRQGHGAQSKGGAAARLPPGDRLASLQSAAADSPVTQPLQALQRLADRIAPVLMIGEVRTMTGDDHWLSPAHGGDAVGLHFTWHPDQPAVEEVLAELERELPASARPHWGKLFVMDPDRIRGLYPRWDDFVALREECDPHGALRNDYTERLGL